MDLFNSKAVHVAEGLQVKLILPGMQQERINFSADIQDEFIPVAGTKKKDAPKLRGSVPRVPKINSMLIQEAKTVKEWPGEKGFVSDALARRKALGLVKAATLPTQRVPPNIKVDYSRDSVDSRGSLNTIGPLPSRQPALAPCPSSSGGDSTPNKRSQQAQAQKISSFAWPFEMLDGGPRPSSEAQPPQTRAEKADARIASWMTKLAKMSQVSPAPSHGQYGRRSPLKRTGMSAGEPAQARLEDAPMRGPALISHPPPARLLDDPLCLSSDEPESSLSRPGAAPSSEMMLDTSIYLFTQQAFQEDMAPSVPGNSQNNFQSNVMERWKHRTERAQGNPRHRNRPVGAPDALRSHDRMMPMEIAQLTGPLASSSTTDTEGIVKDHTRRKEEARECSVMKLPRIDQSIQHEADMKDFGASWQHERSPRRLRASKPASRESSGGSADKRESEDALLRSISLCELRPPPMLPQSSGEVPLKDHILVATSCSAEEGPQDSSQRQRAATTSRRRVLPVPRRSGYQRPAALMLSAKKEEGLAMDTFIELSGNSAAAISPAVLLPPVGLKAA